MQTQRKITQPLREYKVKLIMENWRKFLSEGVDSRIRKQIDTLLAIDHQGLKAGVVITDKDTFGVSFKYCFIKPNGSWFDIEPDDAEQYVGRKIVKTGIPYGEVQIRDEDKNGECLGAWEVFSSGATRGFGPLLYELALEWASQRGGGLMSDRMSVSDYAMAVWGKYDSRGDVKSAQLDIDMMKTNIPDELGDELFNLTDTPDDDCNQSKAVRDKALNWDDTPMSKVYIKKSTEVMSALGDRLIIDL